MYVQGDAQRAEQLSDSQFTGCVCVMALITMADLRAAFESIRRILKPGGWLVFAIPHPCFGTPYAQWTPCLILSMQQPESSPAILTNDSGSHRTRTEYGAGLQTITACSARISTR